MTATEVITKLASMQVEASEIRKWVKENHRTYGLTCDEVDAIEKRLRSMRSDLHHAHNEMCVVKRFNDGITKTRYNR